MSLKDIVIFVGGAFSLDMSLHDISKGLLCSKGLSTKISSSGSFRSYPIAIQIIEAQSHLNKVIFLCMYLFCLIDLILYVPSTIFQLCRDGSAWVEPVLS